MRANTGRAMRGRINANTNLPCAHDVSRFVVVVVTTGAMIVEMRLDGLISTVPR